jgi:nucleoside-diphosphate-sugar epimerase
MKTVVTGGAGFIGSHLVKRLLDEGREVVIADDFSKGSIQNLLNLDIELSDLAPSLSDLVIDLRDFTQTSKLIKDADVVFHLAARVGSIEYLHGSEMSELEALQTNLVIDANVFKACLQSSVKKLVYASSVSIYPINLQHRPDVVLTEDELKPSQTQPWTSWAGDWTINPDGGYGWAKLLGEIQLSWLKTTQIGIARIFNIYGENEDPNHESAHVIPSLIRKAILYPDVEYLVWGDGKQSRDFLYVSDCVDALIELEANASYIPVVVNIGSDKTVSIGELAEKIAELSGKGMKPVYETQKLVGPLSRTADITRARRLLGWQPKISLEEGLRRTYSWVQRQTEVVNVS